jgi:hypothetical protein
MKKCSFILAIIILTFSNITLSQAVVNITAPTAGYNWIATVTPTLVINFNISTGVGGAATVNINVNPNVQNIIITNNCTLPGNMVVNFIAATSISGSITMTNAAQALSNLTVKGPGTIVIGGNLTINSPGNNVNNTCEFANTSFTNILGNVVLGSAAPLPTDGSSVIGKGTVIGTAIRTFNLYGNLTVNSRGSISYERTVFNFNKPSGPPQFVYNNTPIVSTYRYPVTFEDIRVGTANALATANAATLIFSGTNKNAYLENITTTTAKGITIGAGATLDLPRDYSLNTLNSSTQKINLTMEASSKLRIGGDQTDPSSAAGGIVGSNFPNIFDKDLGIRKGVYNLNPSSTIEYYGSSAITQTIYSLPYDPLTTLPSNTQYANLLANNDGGTGTGRAKKITTNRVIVDTRLDIKTNTDVTLGIANNLNDCPLYTVGPIKVQGGSGPTGTNGGGLYCNANVVSGNFTLANTITTGTFSLDDFAYLGMGHALGISTAGTASGNIQMLTAPMTPDVDFNIKGNYTYNGTVTQVTGPNLTTGLPTTVNDLKIDNPTTVTIDRDEIVNGVCLLAQGVFDIGTTKITSNGIGKITRTIPLTPPVEGTGQMKADACTQILVNGILTNTTPNATVEMRGNKFDPNIPDYISQDLTGTWFVGNTIATLINANKKGINIANTPASPLSIAYSLEYGKDELGVDITNSTINTNNSVTLLSRANGTANFGVKAPTNAITGTVSVERFLPRLSAPGGSTKAWRLLATPVGIASSPTITNSWREGIAGVPGQMLTPTGYGTRLTGPTGMDEYTQRGSMKSYNASTNTFVEINSTNLNDLIANDAGYFVFVRGDRSVSTSGTLGSTILRIKGDVRTGNQTFTVPALLAPSTGYQSVGNPYPSRIKFGSIIRTGVVDGFTVWNPNNLGQHNAGAYESYTKQGLNYEQPNGTIRNDIESGEAIFLHNNITTAGTITISEPAKTTGSSIQSRMSLPPTIKVGMFAQNPIANIADPITSFFADGVFINFDNAYSIGVDNDDARKINNTYDNLSVKNGNYFLVADRRPTSTTMDSIQLNIGTGMRITKYYFEITPRALTSLAALGLTAVLKDTYLNTETTISFTDPTFYKFEVTSDVASKAAFRFVIVFRQAAIDIFGRSATATVQKPLITTTPYIETEPLAKLALKEAAVIPVKQENVAITIQPNPIQNGIVNLQLQNQKEGIYQVQIANQLGQVIKTQTIKVQNKKSLYTINLGTTSKGTYQASIVDEAGNKKVIGFVVN